MLKIPTEFPHPGSEAVLMDSLRRERRVRIVTHLDGDRAFVTGKDQHGQISLTVDMDRLRPFAEPRAAIDLWADGRVVSVLHPARTSASDAWADFKRWYFRVYQANTTVTPVQFKHALKDRGFVLERGSSLQWAFALAPESVAA